MNWLVPEVVPIPSDFVGFDPTNHLPDADFKAYHRHLPHWRRKGACYGVTFRLRDSLPNDVILAFQAERAEWLKRLDEAARSACGEVPVSEREAWEKFGREQHVRLDRFLDGGRGECLWKAPDFRSVLCSALHHFDGERVELQAYVIMPNHVHILCRPLGETRLEELCGSWKRRSAQQVQRRLGRTGALWLDESHDRIIRGAIHYQRAVCYIARNPIEAGLSSHEATVWFHPRIREANGWP